MDAPRIVVLVLLLLILWASPETKTVSPSQQRQLDRFLIQERHDLAVLQRSGYGDLDAGQNKWVNVTGLREQDGYAWDLLPKVQERVRQQAETISSAWHVSTGLENNDIADDRISTSNASFTAISPDQRTPLYHNLTSIVHGRWVRSKVATDSPAPRLNLTKLVPDVMYTTNHYSRNITGLEGELRIRIRDTEDEESSTSDTSLKQIIADVTVQDKSSSGDGWEMAMHGVHHLLDGSVVLVTTSRRFAGIFALPHFALSPQSFTSTRQLLNQSLIETIELQERASETNTFSPWSSSPLSQSDLLFPTPKCEYIVYLQQHLINAASSDVESIESELRHPTGRWNVPSPPVKMSAVLFSPDCGFVLESKGPPDFAPQYGQHLQGPKMETYLRSSRRAILAFAVTICAQLWFLLRQMKDASTPSTRSRISFYTVSMMTMGDGFVCMSLLITSALGDSVFLPMVATAFIAFLCVSFFGMKFLMDIWTVQAPERDERRRQQERRDAAASLASAPSASTPSTEAASTALDTLPLPVTAPRPASSDVPSTMTPQAPEANVRDQPSTTQGTIQPVPTVDRARQELSALYTRFYLLLVLLLFLTLYSTMWPPLLRKLYIRLLSICYLSYYIPQIHRNIIRNCRKPFQWRFVAGQAVLRLLPFSYFYLHEDNVLFVETNSNWMLVLVGWVWIQVCILVSQELFGPRCLVPKTLSGLFPAAYDYHPILREDEENGNSMPLGFTQATTASSQEVTSAMPSSFSNAAVREDKKDGHDQKGKRCFDCAICMQQLEVPVVARDTEGGSNSAAGFGAGVKELLFTHRQYMVTPCRHIFHSVCLESWMRYRLQCPICRDNLPPL